MHEILKKKKEIEISDGDKSTLFVHSQKDELVVTYTL